jgi:predicted dehydrogenase
MAQAPYGVGLIGLRSGHGWGPVHLAALAAQPEAFRLVGIANSSPESSRRAAAEFGVSRAFDNAAALIAAPEVDVVVVCVKVPQHFALVEAALAAGKHVYCEWPLGADLDQTRHLAAKAREAGVHSVIGTQGRLSPAVQRLRDLIAEGYVGRVLSTSVISSTIGWGATSDEAGAYILDPVNGATLMTLPFGHAAATLEDVLGPVESVVAQATIVRNRVRMVDSGGERENRSPDQLIVAGTLAGGAAMAVHHRGGTQRSTGFRWEINGSDGDLIVTAPTSYHNTARLTLAGGRGEDSAVSPLPVPASRFDDLPFEAAINVALMYEAMAADLRDGTHRAPSFDDAVRTHHLIAAVETSAREGRRVAVAENRTD